jgi:hypothetical protein
VFNLTLSKHLAAHKYGDCTIVYPLTTLVSMLILLNGGRSAPCILSKYIAYKNNSAMSYYLANYDKRPLTQKLLIIFWCGYTKYKRAIMTRLS